MSTKKYIDTIQYIFYTVAPAMVITCSKSIDQPGKVANSAHGQLNRENGYFPVCVDA